MAEYVELHAHSAYSFLDGASHPDELVTAAQKHGYGAFALTDHNSVSGSMEFAEAAAVTGFKVLHGTELDIRKVDASGEEVVRHLTLLVEDRKGWSNLCRLLTLAHSKTRAWVSGGHAPSTAGEIVQEPAVTLEQLEAHSVGLHCLSGCARRGFHDLQSLKTLRQIFTPDRLAVELQRPYERGDRARNRELAERAAQLNLPTVATGNVHCHDSSRAMLQDALVAVRLGLPLDACEPQRRGNHTHAMVSPVAMAARFNDHPEAVAHSARIAERLHFDLKQNLGYTYPGAEDPEAVKKLAALCNSRFEERYELDSKFRSEAAARLVSELKLIDGLGLSGFFLLHHEVLELASEVAAKVRGPDSARALLEPGRGRGSSVSSIVCYLTGLSHVDPIENEIFIGRFLNEDIKGLPDIDLDFPRDIRAELIPLVHQRYGRERAALVAAFPTFRARGAIRELGKALGLPPSEIAQIARGSEGWSAQKVGEDISAALGAKQTNVGRFVHLAKLAEQAHGLPRHLSQHPGGMIIATRPLIDCVPVVPAAMENRQITQWDKDSVSDAGFLKLDLLGLGMLSCVERSVDLIAKTRGVKVDLSRIDFEDTEVWETIREADTVGVFQIESRAQMQSLRRTRPTTLKDLTIQVAIVRPGPIQGHSVNPYIERRQRITVDPTYRDRIPYGHPALKKVLGETLGTVIFQDQVVEVATEFAGFTPGQAEDLRRAISKRRSQEAVAAFRKLFVEQVVERGAPRGLAERVYEMIAGFSGFGFPKAHAVAFGLLAYQSTWLRVHYAPEFLCSLLNEQPMGFYPPDALVHDAQRRGIIVQPPDVNLSDVGCSVTRMETEDGVELEPEVQVGLAYVMGVKKQDAEAIVKERERGGEYRDLPDLAARSGASRGALEALAWAGACEQLPHGSRREALWQLGVTAAAESFSEFRAGRGKRYTQLALPIASSQSPELQPLNAWEQTVADYGATGLTTGAHPLELLRPRLPQQVVTSHDVQTLPHNSSVEVAGLVVARQRPGTAKGTVFILLEDEYGTFNLIVAPDLYEPYRQQIRSEPLLLATGKLERFAAAGGAINIVVRKLTAIQTPDQVVKPARVVDFDPQDDRIRAAIARRETEFRSVAPKAMHFGQGRR